MAISGINKTTIIRNSLIDALPKTLDTEAKINAWVKSVSPVRKDGTILLNNREEFLQFLLGNLPNVTNQDYPTLLNKIGKQYVLRDLLLDMPWMKTYYVGKIDFGDYVEFLFNKLGTTILYDSTLTTPKELESAGLVLKPKQTLQYEPVNIEFITGVIFTREVLTMAYTQATVPAFNEFLADLLENMKQTQKYAIYYLFVRMIRLIQNTYTIDPNTKPSYITNDTQFKLNFIHQLINQMKIPSNKFNAIGIVGQADIRDTSSTPRKLTANDLVYGNLRSDKEIDIWMTPKLKTELDTYTYSTFYHEEELNLNRYNIHVLPIEEALNADTKTIPAGRSRVGDLLKGAFKSQAYDTIYITVRDNKQKPLAWIDRFDVNQTSTWALAQQLHTNFKFMTMTPVWNGMGIKVVLTKPTS